MDFTGDDLPRELWLFGFPNDGAATYVRKEGLDVLSDTLTVQNICIASVPDRKK